MTVAALAETLGIKAPSLYMHFAGKREIEVQLIADGFSEFAAALEAAGPALTDLGRAYRAYALAGRFPETADLDAAWAAGLAPLAYQATACSASKKPPVGPSSASSA